MLVTGAEGTIGRAVCTRLSGLDAVITGLSLSPNGDHEPPPLSRRLIGDACDVDTVADALDGVELVVHLGAIPHPLNNTPYTVFRTNTDATFNVLTQAAERGIRRAVIASSINHSGLPYNSHEVVPAYFPIDEQLPSDLDDAYALSKYVDEISARMVHRHWGTDIVALRFPYTAPAEGIAEHVGWLSRDPAHAVVEAWSHLDVRDAAVAVEKSLLCSAPGVQPVLVAADVTGAPYATEDLLDRYAPGVLRTRTFAGREVPIDLTRSRTVLGFRAEHTTELPIRPLP
ncbi:NAD(P)-dependent oxidoreductase [Microlunatus elymi]|uniref:NAD(P)-dependent oxidoreductase n=1 Tax=Microlunatus elymi TaxID=2596828 RepID=A0A516Q4Y2_9ACTN|nr:NAD(P)-dependent oxidoreductase [Microlunatus elymi]